MAEVVLHGAQVGTPVGQVEAAGVPEHVGMHVLEAGALGCRPNQVVDGLPRQGLAALGDEQPRQLVRACGKLALDGAQLVPGVLHRQRVLEARHPQARMREIHWSRRREITSLTRSPWQ